MSKYKNYERCEFLKQKTSDIDSLIANKKKLIILLEEIRRATITQAVTMGLNPNVKVKNSKVDWIGDIPEKWNLSKIKYKSENTMATKYLIYLMRSENYINEMIKRSNGVSYPAITSSEIGNMECILPDKTEQILIVSFIGKKIAELNNLVKNIELQIKSLKEYRISLISEVVTGKIDVENY